MAASYGRARAPRMAPMFASDICRSAAQPPTWVDLNHPPNSEDDRSWHEVDALLVCSFALPPHDPWRSGEKKGLGQIGPNPLILQLAPGEGFEPPAKRLTAACSTTELPGISRFRRPTKSLSERRAAL